MGLSGGAVSVLMYCHEGLQLPFFYESMALFFLSMLIVCGLISRLK